MKHYVYTMKLPACTLSFFFVFVIFPLLPYNQKFPFQFFIRLLLMHQKQEPQD